MIEIKHRFNGSVLYTAESAQDVRTALEEAVKSGANLSGANLSGAYLSGANLSDANLRDANLRGANLRDANLRDANLSDAYLSDANLRDANLSDANQWDHPFWRIRQDLFSILDQAPNEVAALRQTMVDGRINGSAYSGECACLAGTIAKIHGCTVNKLEGELGIETSSSRPAEDWFIPIRKDDKPLPTDTEEWATEGVFRLSWAVAWLDEWTESRTAIAKVLVGAEGKAS
jgi:hypothetical protein